ncbi:MAG: glycosyltransferase [Cryomorphaceae bacterium]|nr:glycosyltransferase [Cryomorphaceae bacterium]
MTKVSIIMAVLNGEAWIQEAIDSVLNQTMADWELIVVDNGSSDSTQDIARAPGDPRIIVVTEPQRGVSYARNRGLEMARGAYICFLDSDDRLPRNSLQVRLDVFENRPHCTVVDGRVDTYHSTFQTIVSHWEPKHNGQPLSSMLALSSDYFRGITWMIDRRALGSIRFREDMAHGEDFIFIIDILSSGGQHSATTQTIYDIRKREGSAMSDLDGISLGYDQMLEHHEQHPLFQPVRSLYIRRVRRILFRSYLKKMNLYQALRHWLKWTLK